MQTSSASAREKEENFCSFFFQPLSSQVGPTSGPTSRSNSTTAAAATSRQVQSDPIPMLPGRGAAQKISSRLRPALEIFAAHSELAPQKAGSSQTHTHRDRKIGSPGATILGQLNSEIIVISQKQRKWFHRENSCCCSQSSWRRLWR